MFNVKSLFVSLIFPFAVWAQNRVVSEKAFNIFTLGDSNGTFPYSWPQQIKAALPNTEVYNISKSGRTIGFVNLGDSSLNSLSVIDENIQKAAGFIKENAFDFIVIELGTNDAKAVFANRQKDIPGNLQLLIKKIKNSNYRSVSQAKIVIISPPPYGSKAETQEKYKGGNNRVKAMSKQFKKIAKRNHCLFVNGYKTPDLDINAMTPDGLHLDATGSRKLVEPVVKLMLKQAKN